MAGERWERALHQAASRCDAVLFLISRAWLESDWCRREFRLAQRLNKQIFGLLIEDMPVAALPEELTVAWQLVNFAQGQDHVAPIEVMLPNVRGHAPAASGPAGRATRLVVSVIVGDTTAVNCSDNLAPLRGASSLAQPTPGLRPGAIRSHRVPRCWPWGRSVGGRWPDRHHLLPITRGRWPYRLHRWAKTCDR